MNFERAPSSTPLSSPERQEGEFDLKRLVFENQLNEAKADELVSLFDELAREWQAMDLTRLDDLARAKHADVLQEIERNLHEAGLAQEMSANRAKTLQETQ